MEPFTAWACFGLVATYMVWQFVSPHIPWAMIIFHLI